MDGVRTRRRKRSKLNGGVESGDVWGVQAGDSVLGECRVQGEEGIVGRARGGRWRWRMRVAREEKQRGGDVWVSGRGGYAWGSSSEVNVVAGRVAINFSQNMTIWTDTCSEI